MVNARVRVQSPRQRALDARALGVCLALLGAASGCGKIIGITDTEIWDGGAAGQAGAAGLVNSEGGGGSASTSTGTSGRAEEAGGGKNESGRDGSGGEPASGRAGASSETGEGGEAGAEGSEQGGSSAGGTSGGSAGSVNGGSTGVAGASLPGPAQVEIASLDFSYEIDSTEVSVAQYRAFLDAKGQDVSDQPEYCSWNDSYSPAPGESPGALDDPMTYVDWCDARAYCNWAGKRLCGRIGGGAIARTEFQMLAASQWMRACGGAGASPSVESSDIPTRPCNVSSEGLMAAGSTCEGSYNGLFDMVGNAEEWVDSCMGGAGKDDVCFAAGMSFWDDPLPGTPNGRCDSGSEHARNYRGLTVGFRCCSKG